MKDNQLSSCLGWLIVLMGWIVLSVVLDAWALKTLWNWFIVPLFSVPSLKMTTAMGFSCIITFLISGETSKTKREEMDWYYLVALSVLRPVFSVVFGWVILQFM